MTIAGLILSAGYAISAILVAIAAAWAVCAVLDVIGGLVVEFGAAPVRKDLERGLADDLQNLFAAHATAEYIRMGVPRDHIVDGYCVCPRCKWKLEQGSTCCSNPDCNTRVA